MFAIAKGSTFAHVAPTRTIVSASKRQCVAEPVRTPTRTSSLAGRGTTAVERVKTANMFSFYQQQQQQQKRHCPGGAYKMKRNMKQKKLNFFF